MGGVDTGKGPHGNRLGCDPEMETGKVGAAWGVQGLGHLSSDQEGKDQNNPAMQMAQEDNATYCQALGSVPFDL